MRSWVPSVTVLGGNRASGTAGEIPIRTIPGAGIKSVMSRNLGEPAQALGEAGDLDRFGDAGASDDFGGLGTRPIR